MNLQVVCCADQPPKADYYTWREFNASLERYGIKPVVLGWGQPWRGLGSKPKLLQRAIEDGTITARTIIFTDAFDVVFAENPGNILLQADDSKIVWNAEKNCFPDASLAERHPAARWAFRYFNSGLSIGRTEAYLAALREMKAMEIPDDVQSASGGWIHQNDQDNWMRQFLDGSVPMALDTECQLFQTMHNVTPDEITINEGAIRNEVTGTYPMAFHFNGGGKTAGLREPILAKLNL